MNILNECSHRALTADFADAAFVVTRDCSGNNFNKRPVTRKKNARWTTFTPQCRIVNDIQPRECFACARNASDETDDFFRLPLRLLNDFNKAV